MSGWPSRWVLPFIAAILTLGASPGARAEDDPGQRLAASHDFVFEVPVDVTALPAAVVRMLVRCEVSADGWAEPAVGTAWLTPADGRYQGTAFVVADVPSGTDPRAATEWACRLFLLHQPAEGDPIAAAPSTDPASEPWWRQVAPGSVWAASGSL